MRTGLAAFLLPALWCAGCASGGLFLDTGAQAPSAAQPERIGDYAVGASLTGMVGLKSFGMIDYAGHEFLASDSFGVHAMYILPEWKWGPFYNEKRCGIELRIDRSEMRLNYHNFDAGDVRLLSAAAVFKIMKLPREGRFLGAHLDMGGGLGISYFDKSKQLRHEDAAEGIHTSVWTGPAGFITVGGGLDFYIARDVCLSVFQGFHFAVVQVRWYEDGERRKRLTTLNATDMHAAVSLRYFF